MPKNFEIPPSSKDLDDAGGTSAGAAPGVSEPSAADLREGGSRAATLTREEIAEVVSLAKEREEPVVLSPQGMDVSFFCLVVDVTADQVVLRNPIPPEMAARVRDVRDFSLFCRMYLLRSERVEPFGTLIRFPLPAFAELNQARQLERVHFAAKENAVVEIQHPFDSSTTLRRRVFDLSSGGMSFRARRKTPFIQPGRILPTCQIFLQGLPYEKRRGRVVYVKQIIDVNAQSFYQVGVQFIEAEEEETI
jgi:hypothetical protein